MKNPEIRFIDDNIDWQNENLSDALIERNTTSYKNNGLEHVSLTKDGVIPKSDRYERDFLVTTKNKKYKITKINDICYNPANMKFGVICRNKYKDGIFSPIYITFETTEKYSPNFVELLVTNPKFIRASLKYQEGTVYERMAVSPDNLLKMPISIPNIELQNKISKIFEDIDIKIKEETGLIQKLKDTKSALLIKMFPQENQSVPELRFDGFTNDWEQRKLRDISKKISEKNTKNEISETFTNSAEYGVISQRDFFDRNITNAENINTYYIVRNEDFVYNPRISTSAPCGPINRNRLNRVGVMSPLYTVFRTKNIDTLYLEWFFKTPHWYPYMYLNGDTGARSDRFSIKDETFFNMPIPFPNDEEQKKIGTFLETLDKTITLHQRKLDKLKEVKSALLDKLLV